MSTEAINYIVYQIWMFTFSSAVNDICIISYIFAQHKIVNSSTLTINRFSFDIDRERVEREDGEDNLKSTWDKTERPMRGKLVALQ